MIFIFTGNGKGKTTSAIGMGIRSVGAGNRVLMLQFLKVDSSENKIIKGIRNFDVKTFGRRGFFLPKKELERKPELKRMGVKPLNKEDSKIFEKGFSQAIKAAKSKKYQLLILDELIIGLKYKLIKEKEVIDFLNKYKDELDIVLTGRYCPKGLIKIADLVSQIKEIKHPFKKGINAKKGVEY